MTLVTGEQMAASVDEDEGFLEVLAAVSQTLAMVGHRIQKPELTLSSSSGSSYRPSDNVLDK